METLLGITSVNLLFPFLKIELKKDSPNKALINKVLAQRTPESFVLVRNQTSGDKHSTIFYEYSTVGILKEEGGNFYVKGGDRAKLLKTNRDKQGHWQVRLERLQDDPSHDELMPVHLPMMFGCVETIIRALTNWRNQLVAQGTKNHLELVKVIENRLSSLTHRRREQEIIYSLPWYLMIDFPDFFSMDFKIKMLSINKPVNRLQYIAESMIMEASIFQYANTISDLEDTMIWENDSTTTTGK